MQEPTAGRDRRGGRGKDRSRRGRRSGSPASCLCPICTPERYHPLFAEELIGNVAEHRASVELRSALMVRDARVREVTKDGTIHVELESAVDDELRAAITQMEAVVRESPRARFRLDRMGDRRSREEERQMQELAGLCAIVMGFVDPPEGSTLGRDVFLILELEHLSEERRIEVVDRLAARFPRPIAPQRWRYVERLLRAAAATSGCTVEQELALRLRAALIPAVHGVRASASGRRSLRGILDEETAHLTPWEAEATSEQRLLPALNRVIMEDLKIDAARTFPA